MRRIRDLRKYDLPDTLLDIWAQQQGEFLLPVQEVAVQRYGLFEGRSLVILFSYFIWENLCRRDGRHAGHLCGEASIISHAIARPGRGKISYFSCSLR